MRPATRWMALAPTLALAMLAACDGVGTRLPDAGQGGEGAELPDFRAGSFAVVLDGDGAARSGDLFVSASDGAAFLALSEDSAEGARVVYRRSASDAPWQRVPATSPPPRLQLLLEDSAAGNAAPDLPALAGPLRAMLGQRLLQLRLGEDGRVTPGVGCTAEGALQPDGRLGVALLAELRLRDCGAADGDYRGVAWVEGDSPNASLRAVLEDGTRIQDLYLFRS